MSARIVGIELRRGGALLAGALLTTLGTAGLLAVALLDDASVWAGHWVRLAVFERIMLLILCPLAVTVGAWQGGRDRRRRLAELLETSPFPPWRRLLPPVVATGAGLGCGYLLVLGAGAPVVTGGTGYFLPAGLAVTLAGMLAVVASCWLGFGISRIVPFPHTPIAVGAISLVGLGAAGESAKTADETVPGLGLFLPNFPFPLPEYGTVAVSVSTGQVVWFAALAGAGLVLALAANQRTRLLAVLPPVLGLAVAAPMLHVPPATAFPTERRAVAEVCTRDGGPRVCVTRLHADDLPALVGPARQALKLLGKLPDPPMSVHEVTDDRRSSQPASEAWFDSDNHDPSGGWGTNDPEVLTARIIVGAATRPCARAQRDGTFLAARRARILTAAWLYGSYPAPGLTAPFAAEEQARTAAWQQLRSLRHGEQERRIVAVRTAGFVCADQAAALGVGGGA